MEPGISTSLYITWWDGSKKEVWAEKTSGGSPKWFWRDHATGAGGSGKEITYKAADNRDWVAEIRCQTVTAPPGPFAGEHLTGHFHIYRTTGPGDRDLNDKAHSITVKDWEGRNFEIKFFPLPPPFPRQPEFQITRLP
jgi:hypothetical protein